jgi:hypothetical protein
MHGALTASHSFLSSPSGSTTAPCRSPAPRVAFALALAYLRWSHRSLSRRTRTRGARSTAISHVLAAPRRRKKSKGRGEERFLEMVEIPPVKLVELCTLHKVFLRPDPRGGRGQQGVTAGTRQLISGLQGLERFWWLDSPESLGILAKE